MTLEFMLNLALMMGTLGLILGVAKVRRVHTKATMVSKTRCLLCGRILPLEASAVRAHSRRYHHPPLSPEDQEDWA